MASRLTPIRHGIEYQDLIACEALLDLVSGDERSPDWVSLENSDGGKFDDVVMGFADRVVWKQVKWAANPGAEPLTIDFLAKSQKGGTPWIAKLASSVGQIERLGEEFELELITNRAMDSELRSLLAGSTSRVKSKLTKAQEGRLSCCWQPTTELNDADFQTFLQSLSFVVNAPDREWLRRDIGRRLRHLGCDSGSFQRLLEAVKAWSTEKAGQRIVRSEVEGILDPVVDVPPNEFALPERRFESTEAHAVLKRKIDSVHSGYIVVLGSPGSGKSTLLNTYEAAASGETAIIVYNCYTGTSDRFLRKRARADNFVTFLARALKQNILGFDRGYETRPAEIETLLELAARLRDDRKIVLIVDGLDYAQRFAPVAAEGVFDHLPPLLPDGVVVVASAQVESQLPSHLRGLPDSAYFHVPPVDQGKIKQLLQAYDVAERLTLGEREEDDLSHRLKALTRGHALHIHYLVRAIVDHETPSIALEDILATSPESDGQIETYYRQLFHEADAALSRDVLATMAASPFELTAPEIAALLVPPENSRAVTDAFIAFSHLIAKTGSVYHFRHDSLRVFGMTQLTTNDFPTGRQIEFLSGLIDDPRTGEHLLHLLAETRPNDPILDGVDCDWLARQIASGANIWILREGLEQLGIAGAEQNDWESAAKWLCLKSCLERADWDGELYESNLIDAWLATGELERVTRYLFVSSQFLSSVYPGPDIIDLLEAHGQKALAEQLRDRALAAECPTSQFIGQSGPFEAYWRRLATRISPADVVEQIRAQFEKMDDLIGDWTADSLVEYLAKPIAYDLLYTDDLDRLEDWFRVEPFPFEDDVAADLWFRMRLKHRDLGEHSATAEEFVDLIDDYALLKEVLDTAVATEIIKQHLKQLHAPAILNDSFRWFDEREPSRRISDLYWLTRINLALEQVETVENHKALAAKQSNAISSAFNLAIIRTAECLHESQRNWETGLDELATALGRWSHRRHTRDTIESAQKYVYGLEAYLEPIVFAAQLDGCSKELGEAIESRLWPAFQTAGIAYSSGRSSIVDLLTESQICHDVALRFLQAEEKDLTDEIAFKSGTFMHLSVRYARLRQFAAAKSALLNGVRSAFSYGYRKDTTINDFIVAFSLVQSHLGNRKGETIDFITAVILILDELTDGRMIYGAPAHFIAFIAADDPAMACRVASYLQDRCRQLGTPIAQAVHDEGLDALQVGQVFSNLARDVSFGDFEEDANRRAYFVTHDRRYSDSLPTLRNEVVEGISDSSYGNGFGTIPSLIESLLTCGETSSAVAVFERFRSALTQLLASYPLPNVDVFGEASSE